jgi:hypothetical protein
VPGKGGAPTRQARWAKSVGMGGRRALGRPNGPKRPRREGWLGLFGFPFYFRISNPFSFIFFFGFKFKPAPNSNSNSLNMCIKQKII